MQALVVWTKEGKTGIEPVSHVPSNARFEGAVTPVRYGGNKKWYPAKIVMLSKSITLLEEKCKDVTEQLLKESEDSNAKKLAPKRKRKSATNDGKASEQDVARALGGKVPVLPHLQEAKSSTDKSKKTAEVHRLKGQDKTDRSILALGKKIQSQKSKAGAMELDDISGKEDDQETTDDEQDDAYDSNDDSKDEGEVEEDETSVEKWCQCNVCQVLKKYDDVMYLNFLTELTSLYSAKSSKSKRFLVLQAIMPGCKQSELVPGSGIHIRSALKDEIKVDFKNKPSSLIRETLYALYGKEQFRVLRVTARGIKSGSYGIPEEVLKALVDFVNKNCDAKKALTLKKLITIINKRAPEWRRSEPLPKSPRKKKFKAASPNLKVISTSPFKCTPLKSPMANQLKSPRATPRGTPVHSAAKPSPQEGIATSSPVAKRLFFDGPEPAAGKPAATPAIHAIPAAPGPAGSADCSAAATPAIHAIPGAPGPARSADCSTAATPAIPAAPGPSRSADRSAATQWPGWNFAPQPPQPSPAYAEYRRGYGAPAPPPPYNWYDQQYQYTE